jgi:hypothetical protein
MSNGKQKFTGTNLYMSHNPFFQNMTLNFYMHISYSFELICTKMGGTQILDEVIAALKNSIESLNTPV